MKKETRLYHKNRQLAAQVNKKSVVDASGSIVGRLSAILAKRLLNGETIDVVNSEKAIVSGRASAIKARYVFKRDVGTRRKGPYLPKQPHLLLKRTVRGMLPYQKPNGRAAFKRLKCHIGVPPELKDQSAEAVAGVQKQPYLSMSLGEVSRFLGGNFHEVKA